MSERRKEERGRKTNDASRKRNERRRRKLTPETPPSRSVRVDLQLTCTVSSSRGCLVRLGVESMTTERARELVDDEISSRSFGGGDEIGRDSSLDVGGEVGGGFGGIGGSEDEVCWLSEKKNGGDGEFGEEGREGER